MKLFLRTVALPFALLLIFCNATSAQVASLKEINSYSTDHFANELHFSQDGKVLVVVVGFSANIYDKTDGGFRLRQTLSGKGGQCFQPGISPDGSYVAFASSSNTVVYNKKEGNYTLFQNIEHPGSYDNYERTIRFTSNDRFFTVNGDGNIRFYQLQGSQITEMAKVRNPANNVFGVASVSADGKLAVTVDANGDVRCWKIGDNVAQPGNVVANVSRYLGSVSVTNKMLLAAAHQKQITIYTLSPDLNSATVQQTLSDVDYSHIQFSPDGNRLLVSTKTKKLLIFKKTKEGFVPEFENPSGTENFNSFQISHDGMWLAASSQSGKVVKIFEAPPPLKAEPAIATKGKATPEKTAFKPTAANKPLATVRNNAKPFYNATNVPYLQFVDKTTGLVGFKDSIKGIVVIEPKFQRSERVFKEGSAIVVLDKKWGLINTKGGYLIEPRFDEIGGIEKGFRRVYQKSRCGLVDKQGTILIDPDTSKYSYIKLPFDSNGLALAYLHDDFNDANLGKCALINKQGKPICKFNYTGISWDDGFYRTSYKISNGNYLWGLMNRDGKEIIPLRKELPQELKAETGKPWIESCDKDYGCTIYDINGKVILSGFDEIDFYGTDFLKTGLFYIRYKENQWIQDLAGKVMIRVEGKPQLEPNAGTFVVTDKNKRMGVVGRNGQTLIPMAYDLILYDAEDQVYAIVKNDGEGELSGYADKVGNILVEPRFRRINFSKTAALMAAREKDNLYGYVDKTFNYKISPQFEEAYNFSGPLALVKKGNQFGYIDIKGNFVIQPQFALGTSFNQGVALVNIGGTFNEEYYTVDGGKWKIINTTGKTIGNGEYDGILDNGDYTFWKGLAAVKRKEKWGIIDKTGKVIKDFIYDEAQLNWTEKGVDGIILTKDSKQTIVRQ